MPGSCNCNIHSRTHSLPLLSSQHSYGTDSPTRRTSRVRHHTYAVHMICVRLCSLRSPHTCFTRIARIARIACCSLHASLANRQVTRRVACLAAFACLALLTSLSSPAARSTRLQSSPHPLDSSPRLLDSLPSPRLRCSLRSPALASQLACDLLGSGLAALACVRCSAAPACVPTTSLPPARCGSLTSLASLACSSPRTNSPCLARALCPYVPAGKLPW